MRYYFFAVCVYLFGCVISVPLALACGIVSMFGSFCEFWRGINAGLVEYRNEKELINKQTDEILNDLENTDFNPKTIWDRHVERMEKNKETNQSKGK